MASKFWSVLVSVYYISYLIVILPFILLYFFSLNSYKRNRNKGRIGRTLKKSNMPKELRKEVTKSYKQSMKLFKLKNLLDNQNLFKGSMSKGGEKSSKITLGKNT